MENDSLKYIETTLEAMFRHQIQMKMFHFQARRYGAHKASDKYLEKLRDNIDKFMEVAQGIYGRVRNTIIDLKIDMLTEKTVRSGIDQFIKYLKGLSQVPHINEQTDLVNIRDEMVANANQLKYLLTFQ